MEAALALRAFGGDAVAVELVDPTERFQVAATATGRVFGLDAGPDVSLTTLASRAGATFRRGRLVAVDARAREARLAGGESIAYDRLIIAVGGLAEPFLDQAVTFGGHRDVVAARALVDRIDRWSSEGRRTALAVVVPPGCTWPLPAYEIALMLRGHLTELGHGDACDVALLTPEEAPLALFGPEATAQVEEALAAARVEVRTATFVQRMRAGALELAGAEARRVDAAISLPALRGRTIEGIPSGPSDFIPTTQRGAVAGIADVWAVGDAADFPIKQGGVATELADLAAADIAAGLGLGPVDEPAPPVLRAWLWDGVGAAVPRAEAGAADGPPGAATPALAKIPGRFLAPFLEGLALPLPVHELRRPGSGARPTGAR
jgi:sulfide:quinone oxidoreductase